MADLTAELRIKLDPDQHRIFDALCRATGDSMQERGRALIGHWIETELHAHSLRTRLLRSEGTAGEPEGNGAGAVP